VLCSKLLQALSSILFWLARLFNLFPFLDMEDLFDLIALGHVGVDFPDSGDGDVDVVGAQDVLGLFDQPGVAAVVEEPPQELQLVLALAQQPEQRHANRSWQLTEKLRSIKKEKALERKLVAAAAAQKRSDALIKTVTSEFPVVARCLGLPVTKVVMDDHKASILMRMSFLPALRGEIQLRMTQFRAVSITARAGKMQAEACRDRMFGVSAGQRCDGDDGAESRACVPLGMGRD
jgi:hypothetical protein